MEKFSMNFKSSKQPRKQRAYRYNAPLHIRQRFAHVHLSKELSEKYKKKRLGLRKGDKVKVMRGQFKGKITVVEKIDLKKTKAILTGVELSKRDGSKTPYPVHISNLMLTEINLDDKKRKMKLEGKKNE